MTPQPQQEYCIGCGNCVIEGMSRNRPRCKITRWFLDIYDVQVMISTIGCKHNTRSRPAPSRNILDTDLCVCGLTEMECKAKEATIRNQTLNNVGKTLNSRIAKMEILDSKNPSPFRKGALMAYRDIEESLHREVSE